MSISLLSLVSENDRDAIRFWAEYFAWFGVFYLFWPPLAVAQVSVTLAAFAFGTWLAFSGFRGS